MQLLSLQKHSEDFFFIHIQCVKGPGVEIR